MSLQDDLQAFLAGLGKVVEGVGAVTSSASAAAEKLKAAPDEIAERFDRVMEASVNAALGAGAVALDAEMKRPLDGKPCVPLGPTKVAAPPPGARWAPSPDCSHDGECVSPNPWTCQWDEPRTPPDGGMSVWGEDKKWFCTCGPCHVPPNQQKYVTTAAASVHPAKDVASARPHVNAPTPSGTHRASPATIPEPGTRTTSCDKHGVRVWSGHLICQNCRRIYQTNDPKGERYAPDVCLCRSNLRPQGREPFAGRALCQGCFLGNTKSGRMA